MNASAGASSLATILRNLGDISSGPHALDGFRFISCLAIPSVPMTKCGTEGKGEGPLPSTWVA